MSEQAAEVGTESVPEGSDVPAESEEAAGTGEGATDEGSEATAPDDGGEANPEPTAV